MSFNVARDFAPTVRRTTNFLSDAANLILESARDAISQRGLFRIALSGGNTPRDVHARLAEIAGDLPWTKVQVTFGDERCVPPDDKDSNYRMAKESLLDAVKIPEANIFRIRGEIDPELAAQECESKLAAVASRMGEPRYVHDLILLGIGEDGHTASLFPGSPALAEATRNVIPARGPKPPPQRVTFTFPLINAARHVCFLVQSKPEKEQVVREAIAGDERHPAARVRPVNGTLTWLIGE